MKIALCIAEDISLGPGYLITYLKERGDNVKLFFDPRQFNRGYSRNKTLAKIFDISDNLISDLRYFDPDMVCFSAVTAHYQWALNMAKRIKRVLPNTKIVFGGVHATLVPEEVRKHDFIDEVVVGDGIKYFGGEFDPDKIFPDREIFLKELPSEHRRIQLFMTSIGCPFNCSYCGNEQLRAVGQFKYHKRSVEGCISELKQLKERGAEYILFVDDILTINKTWLEKFAESYMTQINLPFSCFIHPKFISEEIVNLLKMMGCQSAWMGIQCGFEPLRKDILNRPETNIEIIKSCELIKNKGIKLIVDHIFGIPFETEITQEVSQQLYEHIKPDIVNCYQLLYFPKSKIIEHALKCGYLKKEDIGKINRGKGILYQTNNKGQKYYDTYVKSMITIPLGSIIYELLPIWIIKVLVLIKSGRAFTLRAIIQNEIFFAWRALKIKWKLLKNYIKK